MGLSSKFSLVKKLTISTFLMTSLAMVVVTAAIYFSAINFGKKVLSDVLTEKTFFLQKAFTGPLWTYDQILIDEIGNSLFINSKYVQTTKVKLIDAQNKILFERSVMKTDQDLFSQTIMIDIIKENQKIGQVSLSMTNEGYIVGYRKQLLLILFIAIFILSLFTIALKYYFEFSLSNPMEKILQQVQDIKNEKYQMVTLKGLPQELQIISQALNHAGQIIKKRNFDISNHSIDLERLVLERTTELTLQIEKNLNSARLAALGEMAASVAHEINNPLAVIDLNAIKVKKLSSAKSDQYNVKEKNVADINLSLEKIQMMVVRIAKIIKGLKALSRNGERDPLVAFRISTMLEDVRVVIEMKLNTALINFEIVSNVSDGMGIGREVQVSQVLVNLIGNSIDAISELAHTEKWVKLQVFEEDEFIVFTITDGGHGIPEEILNKMMTPFYTTKGVSKGTGLGLSISKTIIEEHGGSFEYNKNSANTQFVFKIRNAKFNNIEKLEKGTK